MGCLSGQPGGISVLNGCTGDEAALASAAGTAFVRFPQAPLCQGAGFPKSCCFQHGFAESCPVGPARACKTAAELANLQEIRPVGSDPALVALCSWGAGQLAGLQ